MDTEVRVENILNEATHLDSETLKLLRDRIGKLYQKKLDDRRKELLNEIKREAAIYGMNPVEFLNLPLSQPQKSKPKYINPANPSETWNGTGRPPEWYKMMKSDGESTESQHITTQTH